MRILHAETREQHLGVAVGNVIAISIRIEEKIWRLDDENAAISQCHARGQIQAGNKIAHLMKMTIALDILQDRDLVGAPRPLRWWLRDFVVYGAEVLID